MVEQTEAVKGLTAKQREVYDLLARGLTPADVAKELGVKPNVVFSHVTRLNKKGLVDADGALISASGNGAVETDWPETPTAREALVGATPIAPVHTLIEEEEARLRDLLARIGAEGEQHDAAIVELKRSIEKHESLVSQLESQAKRIQAALDAFTFSAGSETSISG